MEKQQAPQWVQHARRFIAIGRLEDLTAARDVCTDQTIKEFLGKEELAQGDVDQAVWQSIAQSLQQQGRLAESACVQILGLQQFALLATQPERLDLKMRTVTHQACNRAASLSQQYGFAECEAFFSNELGLRAVKLHQRNEANSFLRQAIDIYGKLAETEPEVYGPYVVRSLSNLGGALTNQRNFAEARKALDESVDIYRKLAQTKPEVYHLVVAGTLNNLGAVLIEQHNYSEARKALDESVDIYRKLAEIQPEVFQRDVAMTLNNLGNVLRVQRDFPDALKALDEAVDIYRKLAEAQPEVYRPDVAGTLDNLGNALVDHRNFPEARKAFDEALEIRRKLAETQPEVHQPNVTITLNNLGIALRGQRNFPEALNALDEAVDICRKLAKIEPEVYQPDVAMSLNNLGDVLKEQRNFPDARTALYEAVDIYRKLAETQPEVHQPNVATTLNNLGDVLREQRNFPEARKALDEALEIGRKLAETQPEVYQPDLAKTLNGLGNVLGGQRNFPEARKALDEAVDIWRKLAEVEPKSNQPHVAMTLNNLSNVLTEQRSFPDARTALYEAVDIYRKLAETEPEVYQPDVGMTLSNLGDVLREQRNFPDAIGALVEALEIRRKLAETEPEVYQPDVASTLNNLGNALRQQRNFPEARKAHEEAFDIYRKFAETELEVYQPNVAMTLTNLGAVLTEQHNYSEARKAFDEALDIYGKLAETEPEVYEPDVASILNNLGNVLEKSEDPQGALTADERAIMAAEDDRIQPSQLWLSKGNAASAYRRRLHSLARSKQPEGVFRILAALREGPVRSLGNDPNEGLDACAAALDDAESRTGKPLRILVAQGVHGYETLLAVLQSHATVPIQFDLGESFGKAADQLFQEIQTVFNRKDERRYEERRERIDRLAMEVWNVLPAFVRETLNHRADHTVLVSGDRNWNAFPWEILPCNEEAEFPFLGLHRVLARWSPLTAAAIRYFEPFFFGNGKKTAAVFCPWNATEDPATHLRGSKNEAKGVADLLKREELGYRLVPEGDCIAGENSTVDAFERVLANSASLIHYTGHGSVFDDEEFLVLHNGQNGEPHRPFGRKEINNLKERLERNKLLEHKPLVVLNSCMTGQTRDFGGQREDLTATFLEEGAEAVIASALPVYDWLGRMFGESLYTAGFVSSKGMGQTLVNVRRVVELAAREYKSKSWPTWALLTYHGNPLAQFPHMREQMLDNGARQPGFFAFLADILHLRGPEEAEALVRRIAN